MSRSAFTLLAAWMWFGGAALAHHSVGINFDSTKAFNLTGVLKELDIRNPHSQVTLSVKGTDGVVKDWFIEWSDKNALLRQSRLRADESRGHGDDQSQPETATGERGVFPECNTP